MLQGTGSDVGKSILVAALCRIARQQGYAVAPFKPQNMSNNAHACSNGGEIGRAQAVQAQAAGIEPCVDLNPVLLKPQSDRTAQVVVQGEVLDTQSAQHYMDSRDRLLTPVTQSFRRLVEQYDLLIVEGAGSPAEVNLRARDIANMGFAQAAGVPVCLIGDIDRGGVIAALAGTQAVLDAQDAAYIQGFVINKFRGDPQLFEDGIRLITQRTGWPCWGVVPWLPAARRLPAEDAVPLEQGASRQAGGDQAQRQPIKVAAPLISRVANFDDLDPLRLETDVDVVFVPPGSPIPRDTDVVVLLGTKSTLADLDFLHAQGWHHDIYAHVRQGGRVLGLCGGYQMLGKVIDDPDGFDGTPRQQAAGLGLLDVQTRMLPDKVVRPVRGICVDSDAPVEAYEIHTGETSGADALRPLFQLTPEFARPGSTSQREGAQSANGKIQGTYLHGLFKADAFRRHWLQQIRADWHSEFVYRESVEQAMDELAEQVSAHLDVAAVFDAAQPVGWHPAL
ncbi:MAG: cobyric acid synthase [Pseudomonadota bacterium]